MITYHSLSALVQEADELGVKLPRLVLEDQASCLDLPEQEILERMANTLDVMRSSARKGLDPDTRSLSGLSGGNGHKMRIYASGGLSLGGSFCANAIALAIAISECNASMGKIVAAPTAGSCGILPAALLALMDERDIDQESVCMALITAGAIGMVIANEATIAGSEGGCQAECGSAAAMTAGALVELVGGTNEMIAHACAIALKNMLGLVCDPVAGLVEVPCVKRNAGGLMCAIGAADMALAGIESVIPVDEVIGAMREVGESLPGALRETALGGLAQTPTGLSIAERLFGKQ